MKTIKLILAVAITTTAIYCSETLTKTNTEQVQKTKTCCEYLMEALVSHGEGKYKKADIAMNYYIKLETKKSLSKEDLQKLCDKIMAKGDYVVNSSSIFYVYWKYQMTAQI